MKSELRAQLAKKALETRRAMRFVLGNAAWTTQGMLEYHRLKGVYQGIRWAWYRAWCEPYDGNQWNSVYGSLPKRVGWGGESEWVTAYNQRHGYSIAYYNHISSQWYDQHQEILTGVTHWKRIRSSDG